MRPIYIADQISFISSYNEKFFKQSCWENQNTYLMFSNAFSKIVTFYETRWKNIVEPNRPNTTTWRMRIWRWIPKATNTQNM